MIFVYLCTSIKQSWYQIINQSCCSYTSQLIFTNSQFSSPQWISTENMTNDTFLWLLTTVTYTHPPDDNTTAYFYSISTRDFEANFPPIQRRIQRTNYNQECIHHWNTFVNQNVKENGMLIFLKELSMLLEMWLSSDCRQTFLSLAKVIDIFSFYSVSLASL